MIANVEVSAGPLGVDQESGSRSATGTYIMAELVGSETIDGKYQREVWPLCAARSLGPL